MSWSARTSPSFLDGVLAGWGRRTLRGRVALALGLFAVTTLLAVGGTLWVGLRDLHEESSTAALAELVVPVVVEARTRLANVPLNGLPSVRRYLVAATGIVASGVDIHVARDDGTVLASATGGRRAVLRLPLGDGASPGTIRRGMTVLPDGTNALYAATPIFGDRLPGGARWLALTRPDDSGRLATADVIRALLLAALVLLLVGVPLAAWLARSIAHPLDRLAAASGAVARGDVPGPLPVGGPDEVAHATHAFNSMSAEVTRSREAQRQLLADVRHDLRTPLTVIGGFAAALRDGTATGDDAARAAHAIGDESARLERMIGDLGALSELERGGRPMATDVLDGSELVIDAALRFEGSAAAAGQEVAVRGATAPLPLIGDQGAIERILGNLVANALRHAPMPDGHVWLEAEPVGADAAPVGGPGGWVGRAGVVLAVRDDGPGIPPDALPRVFDRFYRADPARSGRGSGLGLAIVAELAHAQNGHTFAENVTGGGARVGVVLPAAVGLEVRGRVGRHGAPDRA